MPESATAEKDKGVRFLSSIEIETITRELRQKHELDTIPVPVIALANKLGIEVRGAEFARRSYVGMISKKEGVVTINYRMTDPEIRKRFTIAHELGHFVLHLSDNLRFVDSEVNLYRLAPPEGGVDSDSARREIQANLFAEALLMPERQVRQFWPETRSIGEMARIFKVSRQAMGIRVAALGIE
jgi:Zn-dependent peptidase ImmA (M78 family)